MCLRFCLPLFVLGLAILCPCVDADEIDATLDADLQRLVGAMKDNNYGVAVDMMYAPVAVAGGGREAMKTFANQHEGRLADMGFKIVSYETIKPYTRITTPAHDYVIVPAHMIMEVRSQRFEVSGYQLAIRVHGAQKWEYLDGEGITPEMKDKFLADLANNHLPAVKTTKLD